MEHFVLAISRHIPKYYRPTFNTMKINQVNLKKELLVTALLWYSLSDTICLVSAEDVCESADTCPTSDCCRPSLCTGAKKCCDQATLDKGEDFSCALSCAQCSKLSPIHGLPIEKRP